MQGKRKPPFDEATLIKNPNEFDKTNRHLLRDPQIYPILEILSGPKQGVWFSLSHQPEVAIGRANVNKIVLEDNSVSRSHAVVFEEDGKHYVKDAGSRNGTAVNNKKIQGNYLLKHGDSIKLGIYELKFLTETEEDTPIEEEEVIEEAPKDFEEKTLLNQAVDLSPTEKPAEKPAANLPVVKEEVKQSAPIAPVLQSSPNHKNNQKVIFGIIAILAILTMVSFVSYKIFYKKGNVTVKQPVAPVNPKVITPPIPTTQPNTVEYNDAAGVPVFLDVDAQPLQAKIFYRGKEIGVTPFKINEVVPIGQPQELTAVYHFEEMNRDFSEKKSFTVSKQDDVATVRFEGSTGSVKVKSLPKGVQVYLEGTFISDQLKSQTIKLNDIVYTRPIYLPYGKYVLEMKQSDKLAGSETVVDVVKYRREFILSKESPVYEIASSDQDLSMFPAKIKSEPPQAEVIVDGKKYGETPFEGNLPLGTHQLVIRKEGFFDHQQPLAMTMNTYSFIEVALKTSAAGQYINKGKDLIRQGQYQQAIEQFAESLNHHPGALEVGQIQTLLGNCYIKTGANDIAISYFEKARTQEKYRGQADLGIAEANLNSGNKDVALSKIVDLMINEKDEKIKSDAENLFHKISPLKSVILVSSDPPGAKLTLNNREIAQATPVLLSDLSLGSYRVSLEKDGYKSFETRVQLVLSSFKPVLVKLEPLR